MTKFAGFPDFSKLPEHVLNDERFMEDLAAIKALNEWHESRGISRVRAIHIALLFLAWESKSDKELREILIDGLKTAPGSWKD